jgi:hypothetical protein
LALCGQQSIAHASSFPVTGLSGVMEQDPGLHRIYAAQPSTNKIFILDSNGLSLINVFGVPRTPVAMVVDRATHHVWVASDAAGVLTEFDGVTLQKVSTTRVGGHPGGLALVDGGSTLLISDKVTGVIQQRSVRSKVGAPKDVTTMGPVVSSTAVLSPAQGYADHKVLIWGRNFTPGERVQVSWGIVPLTTLKADEIGSVAGQFVVPKRADLGLHLVVLQGRTSTRAESAILTVVPTPPPPKLKVKKVVVPKPSLMRRMQILLDSTIVLAPPAILARGPLSSLRTKIPAMYLVVAYVICTIVLVVLRVRRKRAPSKPKKQKRRAPAKRLAIPARASL